MRNIIYFLILLVFYLFPNEVYSQDFSEVKLPQDYYWESLEEINILIDDPQSNLNFKRAVYLVENAFYQGQLKEENFEKHIEVIVNSARSINQAGLIEYEESDLVKIQTHASLFKIMTDSLSFNYGNDILLSIPFTYDFDDVFGKENWSQMFVSKLLNTRKGNCHSLPYLYKILADELGEKAYLALAPNHIYIKLYSEKTGWYNTELTSASFPIDAWLMASGYVHMDAIRNEVYMDTLSQKESLALTLLDLAQGYERKFGVQNGEFILKAANKALEVNPNFINALLLKAETQKKLFEDKMLLKSIDDPNVLIQQDEEARSLFLEMQSIYVKIHQLGYRQMPEEMYLDWLMSLEKEKERYQNKAIPVE